MFKISQLKAVIWIVILKVSRETQTSEIYWSISSVSIKTEYTKDLKLSLHSIKSMMDILNIS